MGGGVPVISLRSVSTLSPNGYLRHDVHPAGDQGFVRSLPWYAFTAARGFLLARFSTIPRFTPGLLPLDFYFSVVPVLLFLFPVFPLPALI